MMTISQAAVKKAEYSKTFQNIKWEELCFQDGNQLHDIEGVAPGIVGSAVDYLSRMMITGDKNKAFEISFLFKKQSFFVNNPNHEYCRRADQLLEQITGLDDSSIINACQLVCYDLLYRADSSAFKAGFEKCVNLSPENYKPTVDNIRVMVQRCIEYFKDSVTETGFCVKYGNLYGDGDVLTATELCDLKTNRKKPDLSAKRQVLLYWYIGLHTEESLLDFSKIDTLSIFNPRLNMAWKLKVSQLPDELLDDLDVFCWMLS